MKRFNILFESTEQLDGFIADGSLSENTPYLILIHTPIHSSEAAVQLAREVQRRFFVSEILGTSTSDVLFEGKLYNDKCMLSFIEFEKTGFTVDVIDLEQLSPKRFAEKVYTQTVRSDTAVQLQFFGSGFSCLSMYILEYNKLCPTIRVIGGLAAPTAGLDCGAFVFNDKGAYTDALIAASLDNKHLDVYTNSIIGHEPIGNSYSIDGTDGQNITEIGGVPSKQWIGELFGQTEDGDPDGQKITVDNDIMMYFPMVLENHHGASRFIRYDSKAEQVAWYHEDSISGLDFRVGYISPSTTARECRTICGELDHFPVDIFFAYSCFFRKHMLNSIAEWEMTPFMSAKPCGAMLYGEIGTLGGCTEGLNGSCSIMTLSEGGGSFCNVDMSAFENVGRLEDDKKDIFSFVLRRQSERMHKKNKELMRQMIMQEKQAGEKLFMYADSGNGNLTKFIYDNREGMYDKVCLISVERGEILRGHISDEIFYPLMQDQLGTMRDFLRRTLETDGITVYMYDDYSFLAAAGKDVGDKAFILTCEELFGEYGTVNMHDLNVTFIYRFTLVVNETNLLEKLRYTAIRQKALLNRFQIYEKSLGVEKEAENEMKMVAVINYAIQNDGVIPYFQPIHDNRTGELNKYEALMRLVDADGRVYFPSEFMTVAKEYRLYLQISKIMIGKVFDIFAHHNGSVSINLSAYDIENESIRRFITGRLKAFEPCVCERFVFEVLESEDFNDFSVLSSFIEELRSYGVKIAVDDFGSGFSNLVEIARLSPNYIKIDGQIIRDVIGNELHRKIVETILHLSRSFNIDLIAEFVENEELQQYVSDREVQYSQGYFFSKPVPCSELDKLESKTK